MENTTKTTITGAEFVSWLAAGGLPTHLPTPGSAAADPKRFARFLLRSPDSLWPSQRAFLRAVAT